MDPNIFYGSKRKIECPNRVVRIIKNAEDSEDSELDASDEESNRVRAPDSDFECDDADEVSENESDETDLEENNEQAVQEIATLNMILQKKEKEAQLHLFHQKKLGSIKHHIGHFFLKKRADVKDQVAPILPK
ncbi:hypothetical protein RI129_000967 [Pyrocoelia pectoralis]|uniref:Uncharacterized protein n=1 Tax=Pyrocoelia pectoralis TaxID=417401 RepID=A0AAN7VU99_9COLE